MARTNGLIGLASLSFLLNSLPINYLFLGADLATKTNEIN